MADKISMLITVTTPWIRVKPKKKCPTRIINNAPIHENIKRAMASPNTILYFLTGVAKKRLITRVIRRLKNTNAVPNTPLLNNEKPNIPGSRKSI